jgi:hypothetical protein
MVRKSADAVTLQRVMTPAAPATTTTTTDKHLLKNQRNLEATEENYYRELSDLKAQVARIKA